MCSFLTGCVNAVDSASTEEVRVINENLQLKDKIVELENNLDERNQKGILEREVDDEQRGCRKRWHFKNF